MEKFRAVKLTFITIFIFLGLFLDSATGLAILAFVAIVPIPDL